MTGLDTFATGETLVRHVAYDVTAIVDQWTGAQPDPTSIDWGTFLLAALQHRVEGFCLEALRELEWDGVAPPSVLSALDRRASLAEARFQLHYRALQELRDLDPELVQELVLFKGAVLAADYRHVSQRMMGDFDILVPVDRLAELTQRLRQLGYWEKTGRNGPTYFRDEAGDIGASHVCLDVHVGVPTKYGRNHRSDASTYWIDHAEPYELGDVACRRVRPSLEVTNLFVHLYEHAASWLHWALEDDLRLIRIIDIERLANRHAVTAEDVRQHADKLGVMPQTALAAAIIQTVRGELPVGLTGMRDLGDRVSDLAELVAMPDGDIVRPQFDLIDRMFRVSKATDALRLLPVEERDRTRWFDWKRGLLKGSEPVDEIVSRAAEVLAHGVRR